jgi:TRAP-type uncharacterized transport system substrate-binding protein
LLHERFKGAAQIYHLWYFWVAVALITVGASWAFIKPAPPKRVVIATSGRNGEYYKLGQEYAQWFANNGVTLVVQETGGTNENYKLLEDGPGTDHEPGAAVAIVAGGQAPPGMRKQFHSVASLYFEPLWLFYRGESTDLLTSFKGKRIAVGTPGGGGRTLALQLLREAGAITDDPDATQPATQAARADGSMPTQFLPYSGRRAADELESGKIDAAFFISAPDTPLIAELLAAKKTHGVHLLDFDRHEAYARRFTYLSDVTLSRGVVDLAQDLPDHDIHLLAPAANLVVRTDLHQMIVPLLLAAVTHSAAPKGLLTTPIKFPNTDFGEFPIAPEARDYFQSGPPFLQRYLPFWVVALVGRTKILLLPLITLLLPLVRMAPPIYVWRIRYRIYSWYRVLRHIDDLLRRFDETNAVATNDTFKEEIGLLDEMDREVAVVQVPLSYMAEFYTMRQHIDFLRQEIQKRINRTRVEALN